MVPGLIIAPTLHFIIIFYRNLLIELNIDLEQIEISEFDTPVPSQFKVIQYLFFIIINN